MKPRIVVLDGGLHHRRAFTELANASFLPVSRAPSASLDYFDIVIIPFHTDQNILSAIRPSLETFLRRGGIVVVLGATEETGKPWIPFIRNWDRPFTEDLANIDRESEDGKLIFSKLPNQEDFKYHGSYYAHGSLIHNDGRILASTEDKRTVMLIRRGLRGTLLVSTLDPDFHSVASTPGPTPEITPATQRKAGKLLGNILHWAEVEFDRQPPWRVVFRRSLGFVTQTIRSVSYWVLLGFPAGAIVYMRLSLDETSWDSGPEVLMLILTSLALVGSLMAIWQRWHWWRSRTERR